MRWPALGLIFISGEVRQILVCLGEREKCRKDGLVPARPSPCWPVESLVNELAPFSSWWQNVAQSLWCFVLNLQRICLQTPSEVWYSRQHPEGAREWTLTFLWLALTVGARVSEAREHQRRDQAERKKWRWSTLSDVAEGQVWEPRRDTKWKYEKVGRVDCYMEKVKPLVKDTQTYPLRVSSIGQVKSCRNVGFSH